MSSGISSKLDKSHFLCKSTNVETSKRLICYPNAYKKMYFMDAHKIAMSPSLFLCSIFGGFIKVQNAHGHLWCVRTPTITYMEKGRGYPADCMINKGWSHTIGTSAVGPAHG